MRELSESLRDAMSEDAGTDRSTNPTVVEYGVQEMFKKKSPKAAAAATAKKMSGSENMFFGPGVTIIDPKKLEDALWGRLVDFTIKALASFKAGKEHWALGGTIQHFSQKPAIRAELKKRIIDKLGHDPFTADDGT